MNISRDRRLRGVFGSLVFCLDDRAGGAAEDGGEPVSFRALFSGFYVDSFLVWKFVRKV